MKSVGGLRKPSYFAILIISIVVLFQILSSFSFFQQYVKQWVPSIDKEDMRMPRLNTLYLNNDLGSDTVAAKPNKLSPVTPTSVTRTTSGTTLSTWILGWDTLTSGPDFTNHLTPEYRTTFLLTLRKLVIFSVREINARLPSECTRWWVNPLSVYQIQKETLSHGLDIFNLTFEIQPGRIPFEAIVSRSRPRPFNGSAWPETLTLISGRRLDILPSSCGSVPIPIRSVCLCPDELTKAESKTLEIRQEWAKTDPELFSWPPNVSMSVSDYMKFGSLDFYVKSPTKSQYCGSQVKMILFLSSAPSHVQRRKEIRTTFGNSTYLENLGVRLLFLFAKIQNSTLQEEIDAEFKAYDDIVQPNYLDSYHNMTLSHLSMYNWIVTHCKVKNMPTPGWMLKGDDDFIFNLPLALKIVATTPEYPLMGCTYCGTKAVRSVAYMTKYYVPRYMYAPEVYAGYLSGVAYLVRTDILGNMLSASVNLPIIHMDDAYIMGLLAREVGVRGFNNRLITYSRPPLPDACNSKHMMNSYVLNSTDLTFQWNLLQAPLPLNCNFDHTLLNILPFSEKDIKDCLFHTTEGEEYVESSAKHQIVKRGIIKDKQAMDRCEILHEITQRTTGFIAMKSRYPGADKAVIECYIDANYPCFPKDEEEAYHLKTFRNDRHENFEPEYTINHFCSSGKCHMQGAESTGTCEPCQPDDNCTEHQFSSPSSPLSSQPFSLLLILLNCFFLIV